LRREENPRYHSNCRYNCICPSCSNKH